jgi:hypothetical protein
MTSPRPEHLDNHHRDTLRQIFQHPTSHNIDDQMAVDLRRMLSKAGHSPS